MNRKPSPSTEGAEMRRRAEARLQEQKMGTNRVRSEVDTQRLVHELEVHQIELEMEMEELQKAKDEALVASRSELHSEHDKLWKLASNPFTVLGEVRVTDSGMHLTVLGDLPAEPRLGLEPGTFPKTIEAALGMLHPDDRPAYQEAVERSRATGEPFDMNYRLADGHGGWRWIEGRAVAVEVQDGKAIGWVFSCSDITLRQQTQGVLEQSERKFRRLYESMMDAFVVVDLAGRIQESSSMYQEMLGYSEAELRELTYMDLTPERWHTSEAGIIQNHVLRSGYSEVYEKEYRKKDGTVFPVELRTYLMRDESGQPTGMWAIVRDISKRKQREAALRESMRNLAASRLELKSEQDRLWRLAANAFSVLGEVRVTEGGIEQQFFGDSPEAKVGLAPGSVPKDMAKFLEMIHPDDVRSYQQKVERSVGTGEPFRTIYRLADGRAGWRWLQASAISIGERNGKHVHWLCDTRDITDQKETEEALRQSVEELRQLKARLQNENRFLREEVDRETVRGDLVGRSAALTRVLDQVELVAATSSTVVISGETGTGKELVARAIHQRSDRQKGLFVAVNCAALPATLVESELFGHEKGAFTGAIARRVGRFEQADGGTLFLDEVGELPLETQAKMLRVLQSGEFERVGGGRRLRTNVRVIAASNRDLEQAVREGRFRSDLYHRLSIFPIHLPPLRERREDIPLLAAYLVTRKAHQLGRNIARISAELLARLSAYDWPGNVRELENVIERAIILSPGKSIQPQAVQLGPAFSPKAREHLAQLGATDEAGEGDTLQARERAHILRVCQGTGWKIKGPAGAASKLGLNPGTLYWRMRKFGIQRPAAD
jgi:PAS domain S-box-containing protein